MIITLDLDFGELYHLRDDTSVGVIILRLSDQTVESVNQTLGRFFRAAASTIDLTQTLVVVEETRIRVVRAPAQKGRS